MATGLEAVLQLLRRGEPGRAVRLCRALAAASPDDVPTRHLLGIALLEAGHPGEAEPELAWASVRGAGSAPIRFNHGNALAALGRMDEAIAAYEAALRLQPGMAEAAYNLGNSYARIGRQDDAAAAFRRALASRPGLAEARSGLGIALLQMGRAGEALACFDALPADRARDPATLNNRASALIALDRHEEALATLDAAIALDPSLAEAHDNRGLALRALARPDEAIASHTRALSIAPRLVSALVGRALALSRVRRAESALADADAALAWELSPRTLNCRGLVLGESGRHEEACAEFARALGMAADAVEIRNNLGNALHDLGRLEAALEEFHAAGAARPEYAQAWSNAGMVLQDLRRFGEAEAAYARAIALQPEAAEGYKRRATLRLLQGDFQRGWSDFQAALERGRRVSPGPFGHIPHWRGEPLAGRSMLLSEPSGIGDALQFWRFVPALLSQGARLSFAGAPRLFALLRTSGWPVRLFETPPDGEHFDYQAELRSLPGVLCLDARRIPAEVPYLRPPTGASPAVQSLLAGDRFNIGICWQGNPERKIDAGRSIPLRHFLQLGRDPRVRLISLQRVHGLEQLQALPERDAIVDPGPDFDGGPDAFTDTAALMSRLDLVVTSDTAVAHLAGALGVPSWVGLKSTPEWRWMLDRADSPWYPGMRLFRQPAPGDWSAVFEAMSTALAERMGTSGS